MIGIRIDHGRRIVVVVIVAAWAVTVLGLWVGSWATWIGILHLARSWGHTLHLLASAVVAGDEDAGGGELILQIDTRGEDDTAAQLPLLLMP